jgi:hypothetical protein
LGRHEYIDFPDPGLNLLFLFLLLPGSLKAGSVAHLSSLGMCETDIFEIESISKRKRDY